MSDIFLRHFGKKSLIILISFLTLILASIVLFYQKSANNIHVQLLEATFSNKLPESTVIVQSSYQPRGMSGDMGSALYQIQMSKNDYVAFMDNVNYEILDDPSHEKGNLVPLGMSKDSPYLYIHFSKALNFSKRSSMMLEENENGEIKDPNNLERILIYHDAISEANFSFKAVVEDNIDSVTIYIDTFPELIELING